MQSAIARLEVVPEMITDLRLLAQQHAQDTRALNANVTTTSFKLDGLCMRVEALDAARNKGLGALSTAQWIFGVFWSIMLLLVGYFLKTR